MKQIVLVIFLLTVNPLTGQVRPFNVVYKNYSTMEQCNKAGYQLQRKLELPENMSSVSACFNKKDLFKK